MKTPEELAKEWASKRTYVLTIHDTHTTIATEAFLAGFQAAAPQWISVKKRMPEDGVYMSCCDGWQVSIAELTTATDSTRFWAVVDRWSIGSVEPVRYGYSPTHWMPLPKPPEE